MKKLKSNINRIPLWPDAAPCDQKLCRYCGNGYPKKKDREYTMTKRGLKRTNKP